MKGYIGLDIGGSKILGILYDAQENVVLKIKKKSKAHEGKDVVLQQIDKVIQGLMADKTYEVMAIGAGVPGLVDDQGVVLFSPNLSFRQFDLKGHIASRYGVPTYVGNDVNVAMYGEYMKLARPGVKNVIGIFVGTGVGGALILGGELYTGQGAAGEIGHMVIQNDGARCGCGNYGCLEAYASKTAITGYIKSHMGRGAKSELEVLDEAILKSSLLKASYEEGDALVVEAVMRAARALGVGIGSLINLFHPDQIILGGGVMEALGEAMMPEIIINAKVNTMPGLLESVSIDRSILKDEAGTYGAYQLGRKLVL